MSEDKKSSMPKMSISVSGQDVNVSGPKGDVFLELDGRCDAEEVAQRLRDVIFGHMNAIYFSGLKDGKMDERARVNGILEGEIARQEDAVRSFERKIAEVEAQAEHLKKLAEEHRLKIEKIHALILVEAQAEHLKKLAEEHRLKIEKIHALILEIDS